MQLKVDRNCIHKLNCFSVEARLDFRGQNGINKRLMRRQGGLFLELVLGPVPVQGVQGVWGRTGRVLGKRLKQIRVQCRLRGRFRKHLGRFWGAVWDHFWIGWRCFCNGKSVHIWGAISE